jgi:hypothetical protein
MRNALVHAIALVATRPFAGMLNRAGLRNSEGRVPFGSHPFLIAFCLFHLNNGFARALT